MVWPDSRNRLAHAPRWKADAVRNAVVNWAKKGDDAKAALEGGLVLYAPSPAWLSEGLRESQLPP